MKRIFLFTLILVFLFLSASLALSEEVGRIVSTQGRVDIFKDGYGKIAPVTGDESVSVGDSIRTKSGSKAQILFNDKSILKLAQNSKVSIKDYQLDEKNRRKTALIELSRGKARAIIAKMRDSADFIIATPNAKGVVKGSDVTAFFQAGSSSMFVTEGKLSVISLAHPDNKITVPAGNACVIPLDELPKGPRPYLDVEKKLNEEDTYVPVSISKTGAVSVIKGAVAKVSGDVKIIPKGAAQPHKAGINDILGEGDKVETGENGYIEIMLDNNNAINLKPNTKLTIIKLVINPETGEFENIFEVTVGMIKARIENLKGNSKFEVKTPMAVCGARGTIMYVGVTQNSTSSFFEGGNGYMTNTLTGNTQNIPPGTSSTTGYTGNVSNPMPVSDNDRQSFGEGWDPGSGVEGYSSPEGGAGAGLIGSGTGANTAGNTGNAGLYNAGGNTGGNMPPTNVPFTESNPSSTTTTTTESVTLNGDFSGNFAYYDYWTEPDGDPVNHEGLHLTDNITNGVVNSADTLWTGSQDINISGNFTIEAPSLSSYEEDLWVVGPDDLYGKTTDGARFLGTAGGIKISNSLKGVFCALYIRPVAGAYRAGYLFSKDLSGNIGSGFSGSFNASGTMDYYLDVPSTLSSDKIYRNSPNVEEGGDNDIGRVSGDSSSGITGRLEVHTANLKELGQDGYDWGIWRVAAGGTYTNAPTGPWSADIGGRSDPAESYTDSFWIGAISGGAWGDSDFFIDTITGDILSEKYLQKFDGAGYGIHYWNGDIGKYGWEFLAAGAYTKTDDLTSSGRFVAQGWGISTDFNFSGLIGLIGSIWDSGTHPEFVSIGKLTCGGTELFAWDVQKEWYYPPGHDHAGEVAGEDGFVSRYVSHEDPIAYTYTTYNDGSGIGDGIGSLYGLSAGTGANGKLKGVLYSLCISPEIDDGYYKAGILYGNLDGYYLDGDSVTDGAYKLEGNLIVRLDHWVTIAPGDLRANIAWDTLTGSPDGGGFIAGGRLDVTGFNGTMLNIAVPSPDEPKFGVWNLVASGIYGLDTSDDWGVNDLTGTTKSKDTTFAGGSWLGGIDGNKWNTTDGIEGTLDAIWIGLRKDGLNAGTLVGRKISGELVGDYVDVSEGAVWRAGAAGEWVEDNQLLDTTILTEGANRVNDVTKLGPLFNSVPITIAYSSAMSGGGNFVGGGAITIPASAFNIVFYQMGNMVDGRGDGIWTAKIIDGTYNAPTDNWNVHVTGSLCDHTGALIPGATVNADLQGTQWSGGHWAADVKNGSSSGGGTVSSFSGIAAGEYTGIESGTFDGAGTGTFEK